MRREGALHTPADSLRSLASRNAMHMHRPRTPKDALSSQGGERDHEATDHAGAERRVATHHRRDARVGDLAVVHGQLAIAIEVGLAREPRELLLQHPHQRDAGDAHLPA